MRKNPFASSIRSDPSGSPVSSKFIGGDLPIGTADHLTLLALYKSCSIQGILLRAVCRELEDQPPMSEIVEGLADLAWRNWKESGRNAPRWKDFLSNVQKYLEKRKISEHTIQEILSRLEERHAEEAK